MQPKTRSVIQRHFQVSTEDTNSSGSPNSIQIVRPILKRITLLEKLTRWEVLCSQAKDANEIRQMKDLFPGMFETYMAHTVAISHILYLLRDVYKIHVDHLKAQSENHVDDTSRDAIIAAGGDGTFLEAASLALPDPDSDRVNWVFGINTDPSRSEGKLLMKPTRTVHRQSVSVQRTPSYPSNPVDLPTYLLRQRTSDVSRLSRSRSTSYIDQLLANHLFENDQTPCDVTTQSGKITEILTRIREVIHRIVERNYTPLMRRRIRVKIEDVQPSGVFGPTGTTCSFRAKTRLSAPFPPKYKTIISSDTSGVGGMCNKTEPASTSTVEDSGSQSSSSAAVTKEYLAVNEVSVTSLQSHMSFYVEISIDGNKPSRSKNSGVIVCTGSGSSAWAYNISKISRSTIETVVELFMKKQYPLVRQQIVPVDYDEMSKLINQHLIFDPTDPRMRLVVREPIENRVFTTPIPSTFGTFMEIKPLTQDAVVCIDGIHVIPLQFGQRIRLSIDNTKDCILTAE